MMRPSDESTSGVSDVNIAHETIVLTADRNAPSRAREFVKRLAGGVDRDMLQRALLATSELVTNAVVHGSVSSEAITLCMARRVHEIEVTVADAGTGQTETSQDDGGWGLDIVATVADSWDVDTTDGWSVSASFRRRRSSPGDL